MTRTKQNIILTQAQPGVSYQIESITIPNESLQFRIFELGLLPGTEIIFLQKTIFGGVVILKKGHRFGIGKTLAESIRLQKLD